VNCRIAKSLMQDAADGKLNGADTGLLNAHLEECATCRKEYRQTAMLLEALRAIPVPPPSPGFAERALRNATRSQPPATRSHHFRLAAGIAASLFLLFLASTMMLENNLRTNDTDLVLLGDEVTTIRVAIESERAVDGIRMTIDVSDNLEIGGYRDQRAISWVTRLEPGVNLIRLPVSAIAGGDGEIVARVGLGEHEKVFRIRTRYRDPGSAGSRPPLLAAVDGVTRVQL
jgi:hypothetical protein